MARDPPASNSPMSSKPKTGRIRSFFTKIRSFLTRKQSTRIEKTYQSTVKEPIPPPTGREGTRGPAAPGAPPVPSVGKRSPPGGGGGAAAPPRGPPPESPEERARRIEELRLIEEEARIERESIEEKVAAQAPPEKGIEDFKERKGFNYHTWFKAFGTFGDMRDMGDSPTLLGDMEELEDMDIPSAFYSSGILGKVKWQGRRDRESLIDDLNTVAPWNGVDFRDVYPKWEYVYKITESVGDVVVQEFTYKATKPYNQEMKARGYKSR